LLNKTIAVKTTVRTGDGKGGYTETETSSNISGRYHEAQHKDMMAAGQRRAEVTHVFYFDPGQTFDVDDYFEVDGRRFRISVPNLVPSVDIYQKAFGVEVQDGG
jgi:SPP1 family predicted phage head-tail adaptor